MTNPARILFSLFTALCVYFILYYANKETCFIHVKVKLHCDEPLVLKLYYTNDKGLNNYTEKYAITESYSPGQSNEIDFHLATPGNLNLVRLDFETSVSSLEIYSVKVNSLFASYTIPLNRFVSGHSIRSIEKKQERLIVRPDFDDAFIVTDASILNESKPMLTRYYNYTITLIIIIIISLITFLITWYKIFPNLKFAGNASHYYFAVVFGGVLIMPLIWSLAVTPQKNSVGEQRLLATFPDIRGTSVKNLPALFTTYFSDHFGFRNILIKWYNKYQEAAFNISPLPEKVIKGKDGWLFYTGEDSFNFFYLNTRPYSQQQLAKFKQTVDFRRKWLNSMGVKYYVVVLPSKQFIYPEFLPDEFNKPKPPLRADAFLSVLKDTVGFKVIDMRPTLLAGKKNYTTYYKKDTHWNLYGAFLAYMRLRETLKTDFPEMQPLDIKDFTIVPITNKLHADLDVMINPETILPREDFVAAYKKGVVFFHSVESDRVISYKCDSLFKSKLILRTNPQAKVKKKLMVFRDSYTNYLTNYLSEDFETSFFVWTHRFTPELILKEKPDVVIHILLERFIDEYTSDDTEAMEQSIEKAKKIIADEKKGIK